MSCHRPGRSPSRLVAYAIVAAIAVACEPSARDELLRGASTLSPYDALVLSTFGRSSPEVMWIDSPGHAAELLSSDPRTTGRVDWITCGQGVVAYLLGKGIDVVVLATVYASDSTFLPVWRTGHPPAPGERTLFVPASTVEFLLRRFLARSDIPLSELRINNRHGQSLGAIERALLEPASSTDAIDFAVLPDPFLSDVLTKMPQSYVSGPPGLYDFYYCLVTRRQRLRGREKSFLDLVNRLAAADTLLRARGVDPKLQPFVFRPSARFFVIDNAQLQLRPVQLAAAISDELSYLVEAYPSQFRSVPRVSDAIDPSYLAREAPQRVVYR